MKWFNKKNPASEKSAAKTSGGSRGAKENAIEACKKSRTAAELIDNFVKYDRVLTKPDKAKISGEWKQKHKKTNADIEYARNRHPYWKARKNVNRLENNRKRMEQHSYYKGENLKPWSEKEITNFLSINDSMHDWELAKKLKRSIPSIQGMRRKISVLKRANKRVTTQLLKHSERKLKRELGLEKPAKSRKR